MRRLGFLCLLLAATAARADVKSEVIPFRFLPAEAFEWLLLPSDGSGALLALPPEGLLAWSVDTRQNALVIVGSTEAIEVLKQSARLMDVPPIPLRVSMRSYRADDPAILALKSGLPPAPAPGAKPTVRVEILSAQQAAALEARPAVEAVTLDTSNNRPVHLRQSEPQRRSASVVTLFPHVNGDGSVRLQVSVQGIVPLPGIPRGLPEVVTGALARVSSESTLLLMPDSSENVLMVRVVVVAPPMAEAAKPE